MMKHFLFSIVFLFGLFAFSIAQETYPVNGVHTPNQLYYAFTNATIYVTPSKKLENATLLVKEEKVIEVGKNVKLPKGTVTKDVKGAHIYPGFIDLVSNYGLPQKKTEKTGNRKTTPPQYESNKKGAYSWNEALKPEVQAAESFAIDKKQAEELRKLGFTTTLSGSLDGIARGTSALVGLGPANETKQLIQSKAASNFSFQKGSSKQAYPTSQMGAIALLRQAYYDANWYANQTNKKEENLSLRALHESMEMPQLFDAQDYLSALRADKVGDEFNIQYIIKGSGDEYKRIEELKNTSAPFIIPVNYPKPYDVSDPYNELQVSLEQMKHWELAPTNAIFFEENEMEFAFTLHGLKNKKEFLKNIIKTIKLGLSEEAALAALTINPAKFIKLDSITGTLQKGRLANFIITSGNIFNSKTVIHENWVLGEGYVIDDLGVLDVRGDYDINIDRKIYTLTVKGEKSKLKALLSNKDTSKKVPVTITQENRLISLSMKLTDENFKGPVRLSGTITTNGGIWDGKGQDPNGRWITWNAIKKEDFISKEREDSLFADTALVSKVWFPNMAYGFQESPQQEDLLIKNATVWTCDTSGVLEEADVWVANGKIKQVGGRIIVPEGTKTIDAKGKHLTPGIIDEHSHIAISKGVNEAGQASSAEVSISDVVNSDDINIYRQLSGGVTAAQLLHGSANPIGGQSAIIKLRWGSSPEKMKIDSAAGFIKFALGENVKQSNWGDFQTVRFPQTRMGVEQVFYDHFIRAKQYAKEQSNYDSLRFVEQKKARYNPFKKKGDTKLTQPRVDLELKTIAEILDTTRFISCHSYRQDEINMLMHVADSMKFRVNTFTHILEGYKVADKMRKHGAAGSTFSDWWAYKFEVNDAIPYNGAIMHDQGVLVAFNSDDAEMARRLNQEAAKAVKYGGVSEEDALKFVTINPAKMLHLDHKMGSISVGKDADLVLWSGHPLSIYTKAEKTFIDGICYFDEERDKELRQEIVKERARLIELMLNEKKKGVKTQQPKPKEDKLYHCDSIELVDEH